MPPTINEQIIIYFAAFCKNSHLRYETIKLYLSGIRHFYIRYNIDSPLNYPGQLLQLQYVLRGLKKSQQNNPITRLPITFDLLERMIRILPKHMCLYDEAMYRAILLLAFFGFLRCGEFTVQQEGKFNPMLNLCLGDVSFHFVNRYDIFLKNSKADVFRQGVRIPISQSYTNRSVCPVYHMKQYIALRSASGCSAKDPLFMDSQGVILHRSQFIRNMKQLLKMVGVDPDLYNGHSFRIGAATSAGKHNVPDHLIKVLGRWSSDSYLKYIRTDVKAICHAQNAMARV